MSEPAPTAQVVNIDEVVERYIALRDKKTQIKSAYELQVADIEAAMKRCEKFLLGHMNAQGAESIRTKTGTAFKSEKVAVSVADWDAYLAWVKETGNYSMIEKRANPVAVQEYRSVHDDLPPGVNYNTRLVVHIRRT